ncbi:MAG: signal peptide peptidase SppA [Verrucomicrobia bacterium]|nr:signal peptide peptidase SppA [Verrucomicrobiota bacterium]
MTQETPPFIGPSAGGPQRPAGPPPPPPPGSTIVYAQPPPGRGWKYLAIFLLILIGVGGLAALGGLTLLGLGMAAGLEEETPSYREAVLRDEHSSNRILLVDISGFIMGGYAGSGELSLTSWVRSQLEKAAEDESIRAVLFRINSPGGEVLAADEIARLIKEFQEKSGKPATAVMEGLAASGAYYIAAPCRWIVANRLTITGSIGVILHGYNYRGLMDKIGVRPQVFKSGRFKDMLRGDKAPEEILPEEKAMIQRMIEEAFNRFKEVVAQGRAEAARRNGEEGRRLAEDWEKYADGRILLGREAYELGFVDELGDFETALRRTKKLAGIARANLIRLRRIIPLSDLLSFLSQSRAGRVKVDLGLPQSPLQPGRVYAVYPLAVP